jgi:uncharacterized Zn finger protein (UPF0148 family)
MSDFDREAEREKLREKYERDKEKREASERMSELLLQGATMTNRHCPDCHSPVFRYEGRQFCPTCEKEVTEESEAETDGEPAKAETDDAESGAARAADAETAPSEPSGSDGDVSDGERTATKKEHSERRPTADDAPAPTGERRPARVQPPAPREDESPERRTRETGQNERREAEPRSETGDEFRDAAASLRREIGSLTRRAEETRDIGRKRDLLAAAREAAETLQAIRRL